MTNELLPCPFCGSPARYGVNDIGDAWWCECTNDDCLAATISLGSKEKAAEVWNRRASDENKKEEQNA